MSRCKEVVWAVFGEVVFAWCGGGASFTPLCYLDHGHLGVGSYGVDLLIW